MPLLSLVVTGDPKESVRDREGRPNVLLVTAVDTARCEMERGSEFAMKGLQNKIDYARCALALSSSQGPVPQV